MAFCERVSEICHQCFAACFCHLTVWSFDISPYAVGVTVRFFTDPRPKVK